MKTYKNCMDKINISPEAMDNNKKLYGKLVSEDNKRSHMIKIKPSMLSIACLAVIITIAAIIKFNNGFNKYDSAITHSFSITTMAGELNVNHSTPAIYNSGFNLRAVNETEDGNTAVSIMAPFMCTGKNIEKITYQINKGAFQIVVSGDDNLTVTDGKKYEGEIKDFPSGQIPQAENPGNPNYHYYSEFTVDYENQTNEFTSINICEQAYIDNPEILFSVDTGTDPEESKKCWDELFKDVVITCTVTYTDGTTEEKKIVIVNVIKTHGEVYEAFYHYSTGKKYERTGEETGWDTPRVYTEYILEQ